MKTKSAGTARIYQFPQGGRAAWQARNAAEQPRVSKPIAWAAFGGASYHEDAIREDARKR